MLDTTAPITASEELFDGMISAVESPFSTDATSLSASWPLACIDLESDIGHYEVSVGSATGGMESTMAAFSVLNETSHKIQGLNLVQGALYYVYLWCYNRAGLVSVIQSRGVTVDITPPQLAANVVWDGQNSNQQSNWQHYAWSLEATYLWGGAGLVDPESSIYDIQMAAFSLDTQLFLTTNGAIWHSQPIPEWDATSGTGGIFFQDGPLEHGHRYSIFIKAINWAGLETIVSTPGIVYDSTPAEIIQVVCTPFNTSYYSARGNLYFASISHSQSFTLSWTGLTDPESGISAIYGLVGSLYGEDNVLPLTLISPPTSTGTSSTNSSGNSTDNSVTSIPASGSVILPSVFVNDGFTYYVTLRADDGAGWRTTVTCAPFIVDTQPPRAGNVFDGWSESNADLEAQISTATLYAQWDAFYDLSGVLGYRIAAGTNPLSTNIHDWIDVGLSLRAGFEGLHLVYGQRYFVTVEARDVVGNKIQVSTNGVVVDNLPPIILYAADTIQPTPPSLAMLQSNPIPGQSRNSTCPQAFAASLLPSSPFNDINHHVWQHDTNVLYSSFLAFDAVNPRIGQYELCLGTQPYYCDMVGWRITNSLTQISTFGVSLSHLSTYYSTVRATGPKDYVLHHSPHAE